MPVLHPFSRRTAVVASLLLPIGATACDSLTPSPDPEPRGAAPEVDDDTRLLAAVLSDLDRAVATLTAAMAVRPDLSDRLTPLVTAHAAHRDLLAAGIPDPAAPPAIDSIIVPRRRLAALRTVRSSEERLQRLALEACSDASSGDLARALASLAASTSQHLATLDASGAP